MIFVGVYSPDKILVCPMWGPDQSGHICHHAVFVGILTLLVSSKMVASRASPRSGFLPLSLVLVVTLVGRIAATDIDKNRTVSSIFPDLGALAALFSKTVDEFLNNALSMFQNLPPNYKNTSTEILNKNGTNYLKNTTIIKESTNGSFYGMFMQKSQKIENGVSCSLVMCQI